MAKQKKKRNKSYRGNDARLVTPQVVRVSAVERNRFQEWWFSYGKLVKPLLLVVGVIAAIIVLVFGIISLLT